MPLAKCFLPTNALIKSQQPEPISQDDLQISESDNESDKSGLELVIPALPSPRPPSTGQSASRPIRSQSHTHLNPPIAPPVVPLVVQPSGSGQVPARPETPTPRYSLRPTKEYLARPPQPSGDNINAILANIFQEVPNSY